MVATIGFPDALAPSKYLSRIEAQLVSKAFREYRASEADVASADPIER